MNKTAVTATVLLVTDSMGHGGREREKPKIITEETEQRFDEARKDAEKLIREARARLLRSRHECYLSKRIDKPKR